LWRQGRRASVGRPKGCDLSQDDSERNAIIDHVMKGENEDMLVLTGLHEINTECGTCGINGFGAQGRDMIVLRLFGVIAQVMAVPGQVFGVCRRRASWRA